MLSTKISKDVCIKCVRHFGGTDTLMGFASTGGYSGIICMAAGEIKIEKDTAPPKECYRKFEHAVTAGIKDVK